MDSRLLDQLRRSTSDIENAAVDEFLAGVRPTAPGQLYLNQAAFIRADDCS
jgi:hypothetical protein